MRLPVPQPRPGPCHPDSCEKNSPPTSSPAANRPAIACTIKLNRRTVVPERLCMTDAHSHLESCITEVWELLERIGHETTDSPGITRAAWSRSEEMAAERVRTFARRHGLQVLNDAFGNIRSSCCPVLILRRPASRLVRILIRCHASGNYDPWRSGGPCSARCGECRPGQSRQALSGRSNAVRGEPLVRHCVSRKSAHARIVDTGRDRRSRQIR
jgi:hypothetical protein